ncbi:MAG: hypothetical protein ACFFD1_15785 [Candidatus Thorarchaeota archaeon]
MKKIILTQFYDPEYYEPAQKIKIKALVLRENLFDILTLIRSVR